MIERGGRFHAQPKLLTALVVGKEEELNSPGRRLLLSVSRRWSKRERCLCTGTHSHSGVSKSLGVLRPTVCESLE